MTRIVQWLRKKLQPSKDPCESTSPFPPGLPILPQERQHNLTPSPSQIQLSQDVTSRNKFFVRLPAELRRQIYIAAFGGRSIHIELEHEHSLLPGSTRSPNPKSSKQNRHAPVSWVWRTCVCPQDPHLQNPDGSCQCRSRDVSKRCNLGALGWLLSCRQAYAEGVDVLYGTNKFETSSLVLVQHMSALLRSQHIIQISKLELSWNLKLFPAEASDPRITSVVEQWSLYNTLVEAVNGSFPNLETLSISVETGRFVYSAEVEDVAQVYERRLFSPIDAMIRQRASYASKSGSRALRDCQIALPSSLFSALMSRAKSAGALVERGVAGHQYWWQDRFWRSVVTDSPATMSLVDEEQSAHQVPGYWVRRGQDDTPLYLSWSSCF